MENKFKISGVQRNIHRLNVSKNLTEMRGHFKAAVYEGSRLVVFPECSTTGYCFDSKAEAMKLAEPIDGPTVHSLIGMCKEEGAYLVSGILESDHDNLFNTAVLVGPNGLVGKYRKTHLPFLGVDRFVNSGHELCVFEIEGVKVGILICYDATFPETVRELTLRGVDILVLPTNWPSQSQLVAEHLIPTRAIENTIYVLSVNRVGEEGQFGFCGRSKLCAPNGMPLDQADGSEEKIITGEIDINEARSKRKVRVPGEYILDNVNGRRPDLYTKLSYHHRMPPHI